MMRPWWRLVWLLVVAACLAACASPPQPQALPAAAPGGPWSGRLAVQVEGEQSQSFSAGFDLRGTAQEGALQLYSPLGGTVARLQWSPGVALLQGSGPERRFTSVEALVAAATGAPVPLVALFDWLSGTPTPVAGWKADLSQLSRGRLQAQRLEPLPAVQLRVVLEQP